MRTRVDDLERENAILQAQLEALRNRQAQDTSPGRGPEPLRRGANPTVIISDSDDGYVEEVYEDDDGYEENEPAQPEEHEDVIAFDNVNEQRKDEL